MKTLRGRAQLKIMTSLVPAAVQLPFPSIKQGRAYYLKTNGVLGIEATTDSKYQVCFDNTQISSVCTLKIDSNTDALRKQLLFLDVLKFLIMSVLIKLRISHFKLTVLALTGEKTHLLQSCNKNKK